MTKIYQAFALKSTFYFNPKTGSYKFRHYWYQTPFFFSEKAAIEHCNFIISHDKRYKGYEFNYVCTSTVF